MLSVFPVPGWDAGCGFRFVGAGSGPEKWSYT